MKFCFQLVEIYIILGKKIPTGLGFCFKVSSFLSYITKTFLARTSSPTNVIRDINVNMHFYMSGMLLNMLTKWASCLKMGPLIVKLGRCNRKSGSASRIKMRSKNTYKGFKEQQTTKSSY